MGGLDREQREGVLVRRRRVLVVVGLVGWLHLVRIAYMTQHVLHKCVAYSHQDGRRHGADDAPFP